MSYSKQIDFRIMPEESFKIIRNCSGCGKKSVFISTECFRVNANGRKVDVWLIYQCEKCKHTSNLSIYERRNPQTVCKEEYDSFLCNSYELALKYGTDTQFFTRNRAEIDWKDIRYTFLQKDGVLYNEKDLYAKGNKLVVSNAFMLKVRKDKIVSELLKMPRSRIKEMERYGLLTVIEQKGNHKIIVEIHDNIYSEVSDGV